MIIAKDHLIANSNQRKERLQKLSQVVNPSAQKVPCSAHYLLGILVWITKYHLTW